MTQFTASYMANAHFGGHIDIGRRFGENKQFGIRFNGVYRDGETSIAHQDKKTSLASLGLDWRGDRVRFSANLFQSKDHVDGMTRGLLLAPDLPVPNPPKTDISWNPPWAYYDTTDKGAMLRGKFDLTEQLMVYATAGTSKTYFSSIMASPQVFNQAGDFRTNFAGVADSTQRKSVLRLAFGVRLARIFHEYFEAACFSGLPDFFGLHQFENLFFYYFPVFKAYLPLTPIDQCDGEHSKFHYGPNADAA